MAGATLDLTVPLGSWFAALDVGGGTLVNGALHLTGGVVAPASACGCGRSTCAPGATFVPISVDDGAGDRTVLAGAGASARLRIPLRIASTS
jgi:hypothetical protein